MFVSPQALIYLSKKGGTSLVLASLGFQAGVHGCRLQVVEVLPHRTGVLRLCPRTEGVAGLAAGTPQTRRRALPTCLLQVQVGGTGAGATPRRHRHRATHHRWFTPLPSQHQQPPSLLQGDMLCWRSRVSIKCTVYNHMFVSLAPASRQTPATAPWSRSGIHWIIH